MHKNINRQNNALKPQKIKFFLSFLLISVVFFLLSNHAVDKKEVFTKTDNGFGEAQEGIPLVSENIVWSANGTAICTAGNEQNDSQLVSDGAGGVIITWVDARSGTSDIYAQRINAVGVVQWGTNGIPICTATSVQRAPRLVSDGAGGAIITWEDNRSLYFGFNICAQRVTSTGNAQCTAA